MAFLCDSKGNVITPEKKIDTFYIDNEMFVTRDAISKYDLLGSGQFGSAYQKDGKVYKLLNAPGTSEQYENMCTIKNLNLPNFYKLYEVLFTKDGEKRDFAGTISKYYQKQDVDMFLMPTEYLTDSFNGLLESVRTLGKSGIAVSDLHTGNSIINKDGIFIIDTDLYGKKGFLSNHKILSQNELRLVSFLLDTLYGNFSDHHGQDYTWEQIAEINSAIHILISNCIMNNESITEKLSGIKYPMDYVTKKRR